MEVSNSLFFLSIVILQALSKPIQVDPQTQFFKDELGRVRIFHGVAAVEKIPPWIPDRIAFDPLNSLAAEDIENLYEWGFNVIRLGMMWPGVEPLKNQYNTTYLEEMLDLVNELGSKGIYALLDFHQDVLSRKFCGEGIPDWAVYYDPLSLPFPLPMGAPFPVDSNGYPNLTDCLTIDFAEYYFTEQMCDAFQNLYDDRYGIQTSFVGFWTQVASYFSKSDTVLGYELINEPWAGDIYADPSLLIPGEADRKSLTPLYKRLHESIRQYDNEHILFFEQAVSDVGLPHGFTEGPGGKEYNDRQAYSYHIYCYPDDSQGNPRFPIECAAIDDAVFATNINGAIKLGCGSMLTEFGAMSNVTSAIDNLHLMTSLADAFLQSWSYWQFKYYNDITTQGPGEPFYKDGSLEIEKVKALSRTYAQAIAGNPTEMLFTPHNSYFRLTYQIDTTAGGPTEIYLNEQLYYPNGFTVTIVPSTIATWKHSAKNHVEIFTYQGVTNGQTIQVVITPQ